MVKFTIKILVAFKNAVLNFGEYGIPKKSASLAYYTLFAIAPLLFFIFSIGSLFYGEEILEGQVFQKLNGFVGPEVATFLQNLLENITIGGKSNIATIISFGTLLIIASGVFSEIQDSINDIWSLEVKSSGGIMGIIKSRILSFSMILSLGFLMLVTLLLNSVLAVVEDGLNEVMSGMSIILITIINWAVLISIISLLFYLIFKLLPDAKFSNRVSIAGAVLTTLLFLLGKELIGIYLGKSDLDSVYGTGGTMVLLLSWVYYSSMILFFGAAFTKNLASLGEEGLKSNDNAVFVEKKKKEISDEEVINKEA
ncbi:membrane protein [Spirosomataceae bacterium TFI 002]|nr:membrane protein [Spirosomataceae bacterium TFI 002]